MKELYYCGINNYQQCPSEFRAQPKFITKLSHILNDEITGLDYSNRILAIRNPNGFRLFGRKESDSEKMKVLDPHVRVDHFICTEDFIYLEKSLKFWKSDYSNQWSKIVLKLNLKNKESEKLWNSEKINIKKLSKTSNSVFCLLSNGSVWRLSKDGDLELIYSPETDEAIDIVSGFEHCLILTESGCVLSFGVGSRGQLGHGDLNNLDEPLQIPNLIGFKIIKIAAGGWHSCTVTDAGDLYVWGWNNYGQLGYPNEDEEEHEGVGLSAEPIVVDFQDDIQDVSCGSRHTVIMTVNGDLFASGWNDYGQLGIGNICNKVSKFSHIKMEAKGKKELVCGPWFTTVLLTPNRN